MQEILDVAKTWLEAYGMNILAAAAILFFGRIAVGFLTRLIKRIMAKAHVDPTLTKFVTSLAKVLLMVFVFMAALDRLGVQTASFVAIIGAAGLAVGFALQGSLSNFASGVMLIIFRPFKAGDYIEGGGTAGVVESIQIFNTILKTPDNKQVIVPNGSMTGGNIINYSAKEIRRVDLVFGIGYGDDIKAAKETLEKIVKGHELVLDDPAPVVAVSELADSSVNFVVRPWVKTPDYWQVRFDVTEAVKLTFDKSGISIPFPQRDIHVHNVA